MPSLPATTRAPGPWPPCTRVASIHSRCAGQSTTARHVRSGGTGTWTWHSLRHVFCTTALFTWKLEATDVSRMAGHSSYRITLDMYVGTTAGVLDRARTATE